MIARCENSDSVWLSPSQYSWVRNKVVELRGVHPERRELHQSEADPLLRVLVIRCLEIHPERQEEFLNTLSAPSGKRSN
ncbi:MAG TPA: hypothetical protein VGP63_26585 [Planctomycetaceae bacterium]|nr:hypothetical protein [Planctomycetaceae bacterium]